MRPGAVVAGRFRLVEALGQGGMASIWAARDTKLDSEVAVKFLDPGLASSREAAERFEREALAVSRIASIHVVRVIDYGVTEHHEPYMILERLHGYDLDELLAREPRMPLPAALSVVKQACRALASAHDAGVIHRDIKPANLFLTEDGPELFVHVLDFGVAKMEAAGDARKLTRPDELLGTLEYMSPEQVLGSEGPLDGRADIFSLGVVAYRAITGQVPFRGEALGELLLSLTQKPLRPASELRDDVPPALDAWFARALAIDREKRFASAAEMGDELRNIEAEVLGAGPPSRRQVPIAPEPPPPTPPSPIPSSTPFVPSPPPSSHRAAPSPPPSSHRAAPSPPAVLTVEPQPSSERSAVKEKVLDAFGKHRDPVEKWMGRAEYEVEAWTPEVLRNRTQPLPQHLATAAKQHGERLWLHHREAVIVVAGLIAAVLIVALGFLVLR